MSGNTGLFIFLIVDIILVGVVLVLAAQHGMAHLFPRRHDAEHKVHEPVVKLPKEMREKLLQKAEADYRKILDNAAHELQLDLGKTTAGLNKDLAVLGNRIISDEMTRYRDSLNELQTHTDAAIAGTHEQLQKHEDDLKSTIAEKQKEALAQLEADVAAEKQKRIEAIDTRLADAVASFLIDTMGHDVDLGAQVGYLTKMIEQHKDEFKNEVGNESSAS